MKNKRIAFLHYPHSPGSARLETMPFALNSIIALAKQGWKIDLYLWEAFSSQYQDLLPDNVFIKYLQEPQPSPLNRLRPDWLRIRFQFSSNYICVFGLGQIGSYLASILAKKNNAPFIYFNDEFPSQWNMSRWTQFEKQAAKQASLIVVPDSRRFQPLCQELNISIETPHASLPNIPKIQQLESSINWHDRLNLPISAIPFLNAGSLADWSQVPELLSSIPYWEENTVLILHSRSSGEAESYRRQLLHLDRPGKIFWSYEPLSEPDLNSLVAFCLGSFALYRNMGPNIEHMGFSSGKLMRSIARGRPVITSNFSSLSFVTEHQVGIQVNHPAEIAEALKKISLNKDFYSKQCLNFCKHFVSFENAWDKFCYQLREATQFNLNQLIS